MTATQEFVRRYCIATANVLSCVDESLARDAGSVAAYTMLALCQGEMDDQGSNLLHDVILPVAREVCAARVREER